MKDLSNPLVELACEITSLGYGRKASDRGNDPDCFVNVCKTVKTDYNCNWFVILLKLVVAKLLA